ncbi:MAG: hypothetical protein HKN40_07095, partial [Winogradskyella sp.]|uniref:hypothetical protein n=1 Tax=Winogradskyella sp. TaxID=1883156 RepID=UPI0018046CE2|nr:hypothetical protein [Winogradskyella sp.]
GSGEIDDHITNVYNSQTSFAFGVTTELLLPFYKNKWSIVASPKVISFKESTSEGRNNENIGVNVTLNQSLKFTYIEVPVGIRHYFRISEENLIYLNTGIVFNLMMNTDLKEDFTYNDDQAFSVDVERRETNTDSSNTGFYLGLGYAYKKYALSINYYSKNSIGKNNEFEFDTGGMYTLMASISIL